MLTVISPAKSLDFERRLPTRKHTEPALLDRAAELVGVMRGYSPDDLRSLMGISGDLAALNHERFQDWSVPFTPANARPAVLAFDGDVYRGMNPAETFSERDFTAANKSLRILSGLYGVLRPLDLIQPYRLEMGSRVRTGRGSNLVEFWGDTVTELLAEALAESPGAHALVNLASAEYFAAVRPDLLGAPVVTPTFLDQANNGEHRVIAFFAKRARGAMAGWIVRERVHTLRGLREFDLDGYRFDPARSSRHELVFVR